VYICKFSVLFLSSGIGVFKRVILGGPVGGGLRKTKNPPSRVPGGGNLMENKKYLIIYYTLYILCTI
jgi:hypothetical protein